MKGLNVLLKKAKGGGFILGFKIISRGGEGDEVSHLLFTDDTLIFLRSKP